MTTSVQPPRCVVFIASSLDGFIARSDGRVDFLERVEQPDEDYGYAAFFDSVDTVVIGRKTYEYALGLVAWPYTGKRVVVLTHQPTQARHREVFFEGTPADVLAHLTSVGSQRAHLDGGAVIQAFLGSGLISELTLSIVPTLLGQGARLFSDRGFELEAELLACHTFASGLVQLRYRLPRQG